MEFPINEGKETHITLTGKLDYSRAPMLMEGLAGLEGKDIETIIFKCQELTYISSSGIRALIYAQQKIAPNMKIYMHDVNDDVREILDMCGLSQFIVLEASE